MKTNNTLSAALDSDAANNNLFKVTEIASVAISMPHTLNPIFVFLIVFIDFGHFFFDS